jgi:hypothetical protein
MCGSGSKKSMTNPFVMKNIAYLCRLKECADLRYLTKRQSTAFRRDEENNPPYRTLHRQHGGGTGADIRPPMEDGSADMERL